jgi:uroporphyrinogen decarboxylase
VQQYKTRDYPLALGQLQGFFGTPRFLFGVEELLLKYYEDPAMMLDINNYLADFWIALFEPVLREVQVDAILIWEDMCYRSGPLISPEMFRKFILPGYKKVTSFVREQGIKVINVDSDGDVWKLIPLWVEGGVTVLYPFEVASGMNVVEVRERFPKLGMMGGIDKRALIEGKESIDRELEARIPFMLKRGGFIPTIDHLVPPDVSFENFRYYREKLNRMIEKQTTA